MNSLIEKAATFLQAVRWPWEEVFEETLKEALAVREKEKRREVTFCSLNLQSRITFTFKYIFLELFRRVLVEFKIRRKLKEVNLLKEKIVWCIRAEEELKAGRPEKAINILGDLESELRHFASETRVLKFLTELEKVEEGLKQFSEFSIDTSRKQNKQAQYRVS